MNNHLNDDYTVVSLLDNEGVQGEHVDYLCKIGLCETIEIITHGLMIPMELDNGSMAYLTELVLVRQ